MAIKKQLLPCGLSGLYKMKAKAGEKFTTLSSHGKSHYVIHVCERYIDKNGLMCAFLTADFYTHNIKSDAVRAQKNMDIKLAAYNKTL